MFVPWANLCHDAGSGLITYVPLIPTGCGRLLTVIPHTQLYIIFAAVLRPFLVASLSFIRLLIALGQSHIFSQITTSTHHYKLGEMKQLYISHLQHIFFKSVPKEFSLLSIHNLLFIDFRCRLDHFAGLISCTLQAI